jgi:urease accessory protein
MFWNMAAGAMMRSATGRSMARGGHYRTGFGRCDGARACIFCRTVAGNHSAGGGFCEHNGRYLGDGHANALCYPVAIGRAARMIGVGLDQVLPLFLHGFASNLTGAAMRLVPLGQTEAQRVLAGMTPLCDLIAQEAMAGSGLDDLGGSAFLADIAAMKHETQYTRLFRS